MSYSDLYLQQHSRTPHWLFMVAFLAVASALGYFFFSNSTLTRASKQEVNKHQIVNVFPQQISIYWEVQTPDRGWIIYGESPSALNSIALDEADVEGQEQERMTHYAVLKNIKPDTVYYYKIVSNDALISAQGDEPFFVKSISSSTKASTVSPVYGKVISDGGEPVKGAYVFIDVNSAYPLLTRTGDTGEWLMPMQYIIRKEDGEQVQLSEDTNIDIRIFYEDNSSLVKASISTAQPLPQSIILGKNYVFVGKENVLSAQSKRVAANTAKNEVIIQYPKHNSAVPATKPLIKGKGIPGAEVQIKIDTKPVTTQRVKVDKEGIWHVRLSKPLPPKRYTLTMTTKNERNKVVTMERTFTILKSGERVLGEHTATPSGTITLSPSPTEEPTPTPTLEELEPTPTDILVYDYTPTPTPPPPVSGISMVPYMIAGMGLILLGAGFVLFL